MPDNNDNPFKKAFEPIKPDEVVARSNPFLRNRRPENPTKADRLRTVADLNLVDAKALDQAPRIKDLTVRDLDDLASEFTGVPTNNDRVAKLSLEDIQTLEGVFFEFKVAAMRDLAAGGSAGLAAEVDVSCCCCTPCCCCAATDMSLTRAI